MKAKLAVAGSVMAGLVAVGSFAAVAAWQPIPAKSVHLVQSAADVSAPTVAATVEPTPTVTATVAPVADPAVVAPVAQAPAPVESGSAPAPVVAPKPEAPVAVQPAAPVVNPAPQAGFYSDGTPVVKTADGGVILQIPAPQVAETPAPVIGPDGKPVTP